MYKLTKGHESVNWDTNILKIERETRRPNLLKKIFSLKGKMNFVNA